MKKAEFNARIKNARVPLIVDLWAPWCAPCRAMEPAFKQARQNYLGKVEVLKINADESPDVVRELRVMGIPTVIAFSGGKEILRRTGMQPAQALSMIFEAAAQGRKPDILPPTPIARILRTAAGLVLAILGWFLGHSIPLVLLGAVLVFSAFYDRCPIYRAVFPRLKGLFQRSE